MNVIPSTKFWLYDPSILFTDLTFLPTQEMTREQKLNAITRLAIAIAVALYIADYQIWSTFLTGSLLLIVVVGAGKPNPDDLNTSCGEREHFTMVPTYINDEFDQTIVAPLFAEEQRVPPPAYDLYTNVEMLSPPFEEPLRPQAYPYGQYLTRTNLLPSDEYVTHQNPSGGAKQAREYIASTFMKNDIAFRDNMTRIFKKTLERRFRHAGVIGETFSPFHSY